MPARSGHGRRNRDAVKALVFKKGGGDRKICMQQMWREKESSGSRRMVLLVCLFRGKKGSVADGMAGAGQRLAAAPPEAVAAPSIAGVLWQVGTVCSHVSCLQLWVAGGDDLLRRISAGFC